jgi:hypothetical protein
MSRAQQCVTAAGLVLAALLCGLTPGQGQQFVPRAENPEDYPPGPGREDTFYACTACHGFKLVAQQGMTRAQWDESIQLMIEKHKMPPLPPNEREVVLDYLAATFPPRTPTGRGWQNPFLKP